MGSRRRCFDRRSSRFPASLPFLLRPITERLASNRRLRSAIRFSFCGSSSARVSRAGKPPWLRELFSVLFPPLPFAWAVSHLRGERISASALSHKVAETTEQSGGDTCLLPLRSRRQLRRGVTVDVLIDPAGVRAEIAAPRAERALLRLDRVERPALENVRRRGVLVLR